MPFKLLAFTIPCKAGDNATVAIINKQYPDIIIHQNSLLCLCISVRPSAVVFAMHHSQTLSTCWELAISFEFVFGAVPNGAVILCNTFSAKPACCPHSTLNVSRHIALHLISPLSIYLVVFEPSPHPGLTSFSTGVYAVNSPTLELWACCSSVQQISGDNITRCRGTLTWLLTPNLWKRVPSSHSLGYF